MLEDNIFVTRGKTAFEAQGEHFFNVARDSQMPPINEGNYNNVLIQAWYRVASELESTTQFSESLDKHRAKLLHYVEVAREIFGIEYQNPHEAIYALKFYHLVQSLKTYLETQAELEESYKVFQKNCPKIFFTPNWRELQLLVFDTQDEAKEILSWPDCLTKLMKKRTLKPDEITQCRYFFMNIGKSDDLTAAQITNADAWCAKLETLLTTTMNEVFFYLGEMTTLEKSGYLNAGNVDVESVGVLSSDFASVETATKRIKREVEAAFLKNLN